jgi:sugar lactone lactonase YvrE
VRLAIDVECIVEAGNLVGECPLWHPQENSLYWTDINGFTIQRYSLDKRTTKTWNFREVLCALSLTTDLGWILVALGSRLVLWSPATDERIDYCHPEPDWPANRLNDGATDGNGNFWIGSMRNNVAPDGTHLEVSGEHGSLYRVSPDREVSVWDTGFGITNTVVWSPDGATFYCGCSVRNIIYAYDCDSLTNSIRNRRTFVSGQKRGVPDGSAMDANGYLWNCRYSGGCILRVSPSGELEGMIEMPVSNVTNCCFGGSDLQTLFITTASLQAPKDEALAGGLFSVRMDVAGTPPGKFRLSEPVERKVAPNRGKFENG